MDDLDRLIMEEMKKPAFAVSYFKAGLVAAVKTQIEHGYNSDEHMEILDMMLELIEAKFNDMKRWLDVS